MNIPKRLLRPLLILPGCHSVPALAEEVDVEDVVRAGHDGEPDRDPHQPGSLPIHREPARIPRTDRKDGDNISPAGIEACDSYTEFSRQLARSRKQVNDQPDRLLI